MGGGTSRPRSASLSGGASNSKEGEVRDAAATTRKSTLFFKSRPSGVTKRDPTPLDLVNAALARTLTDDEKVLSKERCKEVCEALSIEWTPWLETRYDLLAHISDEEGTALDGVPRLRFEGIVRGLSSWECADVIDVDGDGAEASAEIAETTRRRASVGEAVLTLGTGHGITSEGDSDDMLMAVLLLQRAYRKFYAKLEARKKRTWRIYQAVEYRVERQEVKMGDFLSRLITHLPEAHRAHHETASRFDAMVAKGWPLSMEVKDDYTGPNLPTEITIESMVNLIQHYFSNLRAYALEEEPPVHLHVKWVCHVLTSYLKVLQVTPTVVYISTVLPKRITVIGDLHGQLRDLCKIFEKNGPPSSENPYLFNGDIVDRGNHSLEVAIVIFGLAAANPNAVYINRGNHEDFSVCESYGFIDEIVQKYGAGKFARIIANLFFEVFSFLPVASVIDREVLVIHGGISPAWDLETLNKVDRCKYKSVSKVPDAVREGGEAEGMTFEGWKVMQDALWSDPGPESQKGFEPNEVRGAGGCFGKDITRDWLAKEHLRLLVRSHECVDDGFQIAHAGQVMTLFSASNYYEEGSNLGAYLKLSLVNGASLNQFATTDNDAPDELTLRYAVSRMERSAMDQVRHVLFENKAAVELELAALDPESTGKLEVNKWERALSSATRLDLPWRQILLCDGGDALGSLSEDETTISYKTSNSELTIAFKPSADGAADSRSAGSVSVSQAIYKNLHEIEAVFRLMDTDGSGFLSLEEVKRACSILNDVVLAEGSAEPKQKLSDEEIEGFVKAMDLDGDGQTSYNEFLEAVRNHTFG